MAVLGNFSRISSWFGWRKAPTVGASSFHKGIDLAAPNGTPIYAASEGVITHKEYQKGYGNVVYIKHPDGSETRYGHMSRFANIQSGTRIQAGQEVGYVGSTGHSTGAHLHFEVRDSNGNAIDPTKIYGTQLDKIRAMPTDGFFANPSYLATKNKEIASDQMISFTLAAQQKKEDDASSFMKKVLPNLLSGNIFSALLGGALAARDSVKEEENKGIALNLKVSDLQNNGFNTDEIQKLSLLAQRNQADSASCLATLNQNAQCITAQDMQKIGLPSDKIEILTQMAQQNSV